MGRETPTPALYPVILRLCMQMNPRGSGCCPFHIVAARIGVALNELAPSCIPGFQPFADWQCAGCFAVNRLQHDFASATDACGLCGGTEKVITAERDTSSDGNV